MHTPMCGNCIYVLVACIIVVCVSSNKFMFPLVNESNFHWRLSKVILESDCAWVAARIEEGPVIEEIRSLSCLVGEFKVSHVKRECNQVANAVANLARRTKHSVTWWGQAPACAQDHLIADCINAGV